MDGVTILSEVSCRGADIVAVIAGLCVAVVMPLFYIPLVIDLWREKLWWIVKIVLSGFVLFTVSIFLLMGIGVCNEYRTFHTEYTVEVDDSVGFNEFYNYYDIISQDGDIYTVREVGE